MLFQLASSNLDLLTRSLTAQANVEYALAHTDADDRLAALAPADAESLCPFTGERSESQGQTLLLCPLTPANAAALRTQLTWLRPRPLGLKTSAGMGDRLGLATPVHVRAVRAIGSKVAPIFAQQSIREMTRTGRTPQQVIPYSISLMPAKYST
jgi:tagaturonate epimerase